MSGIMNTTRAVYARTFAKVINKNQGVKSQVEFALNRAGISGGATAKNIEKAILNNTSDIFFNSKGDMTDLTKFALSQRMKTLGLPKNTTLAKLIEEDIHLIPQQIRKLVSLFVK